MSSKKYNITQTVNYNGIEQKSSFSIYADIATVTSILSLLEGGISVTEQNLDLTDMSNSSKNVTSCKFVSSIDLKSKMPNGSINVYTRIRPYKGKIMFKKDIDESSIHRIFLKSFPFFQDHSLTPKNVEVSFFSLINH